MSRTILEYAHTDAHRMIVPFYTQFLEALPIPEGVHFDEAQQNSCKEILVVTNPEGFCVWKPAEECKQQLKANPKAGIHLQFNNCTILPDTFEHCEDLPISIY